MSEHHTVSVLIRPETIGGVLKYLLENKMEENFRYERTDDDVQIVVGFQDADQAFYFKMRFG